MTAGRTTMSLPIAKIGELDAGLYVGLIDDTAVSCLSVRLAAEGLLTPIWVRRNGNAAKLPWSVIAGRHRLRAAIRLGWTKIAAEQRADATSDAGELRRLQVAENLDRRDLRPIERACFIMDRWREAAEQIDPSAPTSRHSHASRARWDALATVANASGVDRALIDQATADACGKSERSVRTYRQLYGTIVVGMPDLFAHLNAHPLGDSLSAMSRLAKIRTEDGRRKAAETILSRNDWQSLDDAMVAAGLAASKGSRVDPNKPDVIFMTAYGKMEGPRRRITLRTLAEEMIPSDVLEMVEVFKARKIVSETTKIA